MHGHCYDRISSSIPTKQISYISSNSPTQTLDKNVQLKTDHVNNAWYHARGVLVKSDQTCDHLL